ncbi:MAG: hypothetical protein KME10_16930 [Plectolyngbya sp. WJT66-NPBG17]|jgi:hypothetical protein|nr:hypothetical protein [Plectolyngbya sp. WJT66-NPBG17]MBW4527455.1 hypothetical protein [Phormidium tanganyikae FI6-MK23]
MGGVINLIKKLFSGIFSFIGGILGDNKSGYFMELDAAEAEKPALAKAEAPAPKKAEVENAKSAVVAVEATAKSTADSVAEGVKETVAATEATAQSAVKSVKSKPAKAEPVKAETAKANGSTNGAKPPVPANTLNLPQPTVSFATEYLAPKPTNTRRRPGANMGSFLEMAKTVKTPNN